MVVPDHGPVTEESIETGGRYTSLHDYLHVLRRYAVVIVGLAILGAALAYVAAKRETPVYQASASVQFQDPSQDLNIVGFGASSDTNPEALAAAASGTVTQPAVLDQAAGRLGDRPASLGGSVSGSVSAATGNLEIAASSSSPTRAARIANAVAAVVATTSNHQARARFADLAAEMRRSVNRLQRLAANPSTAKASDAGQQLLFYDQELPRVQTLTRFAQSATVATVALPPGSAVSPDPTRNAVIGLVLGLLLALLFAFLRETLDRRLRTARDIESSFHLPVLGYVRNEVMGKIAYRADGTKPLERQLDIEAFRIVRRNLEFLIESAGARTVVVTSGLPEEGKTTVAGSLALAMASAGKRTLLVDCDLRRPTLATRFDIPAQPGLSEFLSGGAAPEEILRTVAFGDAIGPVPPGSNGNGRAPGGGSSVLPPAGGIDGTDGHQLVLVPAGAPTPQGAELLGSAAFAQFIEEVAQVYDIVLLDSSPLLPVADTLEMLPHVDAVVLCARESQSTSAEAAASRSALSHFADRPLGLVVTGVRPVRGDYASYSYYAYT